MRVRDCGRGQRVRQCAGPGSGRVRSGTARGCGSVRKQGIAGTTESRGLLCAFRWGALGLPTGGGCRRGACQCHNDVPRAEGEFWLPHRKRRAGRRILLPTNHPEVRMNSIQSVLTLSNLSRWRVTVLCFFVTCFLFLSFPDSVRTLKRRNLLSVEALVYTTMPSTTAHRPEMALDGDADTYFKSAYGMSEGDTFLVLLSQPIPVQSLHILTGDAESRIP